MGSLRWCGLVGKGMSLGAEGLTVSKTHTTPNLSVCFWLLPVDHNVELSATAPAPGLSASHHNDHELT